MDVPCNAILDGALAGFNLSCRVSVAPDFPCVLNIRRYGTAGCPLVSRKLPPEDEFTQSAYVFPGCKLTGKTQVRMLFSNRGSPASFGNVASDALFHDHEPFVIALLKVIRISVVFGSTPTVPDSGAALMTTGGAESIVISAPPPPVNRTRSIIGIPLMFTLTSACLPNVVAITCGAQRRQVHRLVGQHSKRGVWHRYASL